MTEQDKQVIYNYIRGGAYMGGGAASIAALVNHFNTMMREKEENQKSRDKKLFQDAVIQARQTKTATLRGGLALSGGLASTVLSYALVNNLYKALKRQRLEEELKDVKEDYVATLGKAASTEGGKPMSSSEALTSLLVALPILLATGSGVMTYSALNEHFPSRRKRRGGLSPSERLQVVGGGKEASVPVPQGLQTMGMLAMAVNRKEASYLGDMMGAVLDGKEAELTKGFVDDPVAAMETIKGAGASLDGKSEAEMSFALGLLDDNPVLKSAALLYAAAEFSDAFPRYTAIGSHLDPDMGVKLAMIAEETSKAFRDKVAEEAPDDVLEVLHDIAEGHTGLVSGLNNLVAVPAASEETSDPDPEQP